MNNLIILSFSFFVDETKLTAKAKEHLQIDLPMNEQLPTMNIELRPYKMMKEFVKWLVSQQTEKIWISNKSSYALVSLIPESRRIDSPNPVLLKKAVKNEIEIENMKRAHVRRIMQMMYQLVNHIFQHSVYYDYRSKMQLQYVTSLHG